MTTQTTHPRWLVLAAAVACAVSTGPTLAHDAPSPSHHRTVSLAAVPAMTHPSSLELPLPDGGMSRFRLNDSGVVPAALREAFPWLRSYVGRDDAGRSARIDIDQKGGLHARVSDLSGVWHVTPIEPAQINASRLSRPRVAPGEHRVYSSEHRVRRRGAIDPTSPGALAQPTKQSVARTAPEGESHPLRTFRIAVSATSSYVKAQGGTLEDGLAGVVRAVNQVNGIFENDLGVHFELAPHNERLIFADEAKDPFHDMINPHIVRKNITVTNDELGRSSYDIGHVLHGDGDGGIAGDGGISCLDSAHPWPVDAPYLVGGEWVPVRDKAAAVSSNDEPAGNELVLTFAHELAHQLGALHVFNAGTARSAEGAVEPGYGSTIMGYTDQGEFDLQSIVDPYFNASTIAQMREWLDGEGGSCASVRPHPHTVPRFDLAGINHLTVPARTPFMLGGALSFAHPAAAPTYTFEQMDLGPEQIAEPLSDTGAGPLFRSRPPNVTGEQTFPSMRVLLGKEAMGIGDAFPSGNRLLHFRGTARDNVPGASHVVGRDISVQVIDTGRAFAVQAPVAGTVVSRGRFNTVRWDVAKTDKQPIACPRVDIRLSVDGGETFLARPLARGVANTGTVRVPVPSRIPATDRGRLMVFCPSQQFFALSPGNVRIR